MTAAVDENVADGSIAPRPAKPLRRVALLQGALVFLHLEPIVGDL